MMMVSDPLAARKLEKEGTVEAAVGAEIDVLDDGRLAQPGLTQAAGEPLVLAVGCLAIDEQPEPILATEVAGIGAQAQPYGGRSPIREVVTGRAAADKTGLAFDQKISKHAGSKP